MNYFKPHFSYISFNVSKEFFDSFDILPKIECGDKSILGMQYECTKGDFSKCKICSKSNIEYPKLTDKNYLELILLMLTEIGFENKIEPSISSLLDYMFKTLIINKEKIKDKVQKIFT